MMRTCNLSLWAALLWLLLAGQAFAQDRLLRGKVVDAAGDVLPGVNVSVKGTLKGTITDLNGTFQLSVPEDAQLLFTFVGYLSQTVPVKGQNNLTIRLLEDSKQLEEVVVVGYGVQRKSDVTGAVASVKPAELTQIATNDVTQALQGRVAGVNVIAQSGDPGAPMRVRIRGVGTINNADPLYVVDGFPVSNISFLAPSDIASMEVLKDASATAIYGSRGANGVVLITTKTGGGGKTRFDFNSYVGVQEAWRRMDVLDAAQYATLRLEAFANDGTLPDTRTLDRLVFARNGNYKGTDWQEVVMRPGLIQNYALSAMGGEDRHRFNISGTYFEQEGIIENSSYQRFTLRFNNDYQLSEKIKLGSYLTYVYDHKNYYNGGAETTGILLNSVKADPLTPVYDRFGNYARPDLSYVENPQRLIDDQKYNFGWGNRAMGNFFAEYEVIKGLSLRSALGADVFFGHEKKYLPAFYIDPQEMRNQSELHERRGETFGWVWTNTVNFARDFGKHHVNAVAGFEMQRNNYSWFNAMGYNVPMQEALHYLSSATQYGEKVESQQSVNALMSYLGRANYSYDDRYLLTASVRYDGSSRFLKESRWGLFPSFSLGWNLMNESFLKDVEQISNLKLRAGWGQVGNQGSAPDFGYITSVTNNLFYTLNNGIVNGMAPTQLSNPELQWETTEMANVGLDLGLYGDKVNLTAEYFIKDTKDMIVSVPVPIFVGASAPRVNAGQMRNSGLELSASYRNNDRAFKYSIGGNIAFVRNEVISLGGGAPIEGGYNYRWGNPTRTEVGHEIAYFYGRKVDGVFQSQAEIDAYSKDGKLVQPNAKPGDFRFRDVNGDGRITDLDRMKLGSAMPDFTYGINAEASYKGFDLKLFLQGSQGNEAVFGAGMDLLSMDGDKNSLAVRMDRWTPEKPSTTQPRMTNKDANNNAAFSDYFIQDASFLRLRNVQLGYTLPADLSQRLGLTSFRMYVSAQNLLTFTNYKGFDPEVGEVYSNPLYFGIDYATYPQARTFMGGIQLNF